LPSSATDRSPAPSSTRRSAGPRCDRRRRQGTLRDATLAAHAALTPFAGGAFEAAKLALGDVDLERFRDTLPTTRMALDLDLRPAQGGGFTGTFRATNALPGPVDEGGCR
jgi:hypothetical protein